MAEVTLAEIDALLIEWKRTGADRRDAVRFRFIEAMARRAAGFSGETRRVLEDRLAVAIAHYRTLLDALDALASSPAQTGSETGGNADDDVIATSAISATSDTPAAPPGTDSLAALTRAFAERSAQRPALSKPVVVANAAPTSAAGRGEAVAGDAGLLDYFRDAWSKISAERQMHASLAQAPENAGPLNSSHLVHRALTLMHDVSPDYLREFLRYANALSWLEDMEAAGVLKGKSATRAAATATKVTKTKGRGQG